MVELTLSLWTGVMYDEWLFIFMQNFDPPYSELDQGVSDRETNQIKFVRRLFF